MRFWKPRAKRLAALVCALALTASLLPTAVFAEPGDTVPAASSTVTAEEKTKETPAPDATEEEQNAPSVPSEQPKEQPSPEPSESPAPSAEPTPSASPEVTPEPSESPEPVETPATTPSASPEVTEEPVKAPAKVAAQSKEQPSQDSGISPMAISNETIYRNADLGIDITVQTGAEYPYYVERTVTFEIVIDGVDAGSYAIDELNMAGTDVTIIANRYKASTSIEGGLDDLGTFTHTSGNIYKLVPTSNNITARIELTSFKTADDIEIAAGDTVYGTFSWMKGDADRDDFARTVTIEVNGKAVHTQKVYTPQQLNNALGSTAQYWFTPNSSAYNAEVEMDPPSALDTVASKDLTIRLTTKCPCGSAWCECPGADCTCKPDCDCELCKPAADEKEIRTDYGVISYKEPSAEGYNMTVEVYVNGTKVVTSDKLRIRSGENNCLNFEPANGYYYYNDENSYDIVTKNDDSSWDQRTGFISITGTSEDDRNYDNVLKVYLWTFQNHIKLDVDRRGDASDVVTGYVISFDAYDPASQTTKTYTYTATSFLQAQAQMIPYATNVTLTPICEPPYEVSQWSSADAYTALTLTGSEGQAGTEAYGNAASLYVTSTAYDSLKVYIDGVREVTPPNKDDLVDNVGGIFTDGAAVVVDCTNTDAQHKNETYGLTEGTFQISGLKGNSADGYTVDVTVTPDSYVASYNDTTEAEHDRADMDDKVITLKWEVVEGSDGNRISAWRAEKPAKIDVTCDDGGDEPEEPEYNGAPINIEVWLDGENVTENYANYLKIEADDGTTGEAEYDATTGKIIFKYNYEKWNCADIKYNILDNKPYIEHAVAATLVYGKNGSDGIEHPTNTKITKLDNVLGGSTVTIYLATPYGVAYYVNGSPSSSHTDSYDYAKVDPECEHNMSNVPGAGSGAEWTVGENGMQKGYEVCYKTGLLTEITLASTTGLDAWYPKWNATNNTVDGTKLTGTTIALAAILATPGSYTIDDSGSMKTICFYGETETAEPNPAASVTKEVESIVRDGKTIQLGADGKLKVGDEITYKITVTNTGNVTLSGLTITDTFNGYNKPEEDSQSLKWDGQANSWTASLKIPALPKGQENTYTYTYTVAEEDLGKKLTNTATVEGGGLPDKPEDEVELPVEEKDPAAEISKKLAKIVRNDVEIEDFASDVELKVGDVITYEITVTNTGNVTLNDLTITDTFNGAQKPGEHWQAAADGGWTYSFTIEDPLEPGETYLETYTYTVVQADADNKLTNSAVVTGDDLDPDDPPPQDEEEHEVKDDGKIKLQPADITIYMGGEAGYNGVLDGTDATTSNSLPVPGFYITLPNEVNQALDGNGHAADLSGKITVTAATTAGEERTWTLQKYGDSTSTALINDQEHFVYKIEPGEKQPAIRVAFTDNDNNTVTSDAFTLTDNLSNEYEMNLYTGDVDVASISLKIEANGQTFYCGYDAEGSTPGTLKVRYAATDALITPATTDLDAEIATNPKQFYVGVAADQKFYINEQDAGAAGVDVLISDVSLLADNLTGNNDDYNEADLYAATQKATSFEKTVMFGKYFDLVDAQNGNAWLTPADGSTVTVFWPYPDGTDKTTDFELFHFDRLDREGTAADGASAIDVAMPTKVTSIEKGEHGITFTTESFSPFVLVWENTQAEQPGDEDKPSGDDDNNNNNNNNNNNTNNNQNKSTASASASASAAVTAPAAPAAAVIPQTGDEMPVGLLAGLALVAAGGLAALLVLRKRRSDR